MSFLKKIWKQRIVEYPGRRRLDDTSQPEVYDVSRAEGNIIQEGDGFTAVNMNGLEERIEQAFAFTDAMLSDAFSTEKAYAVGDYAIYDNTLYRFTAAKAAGAWNGSKAQVTTVADELGELNGNLTTISTKVSKITKMYQTLYVEAKGTVAANAIARLEASAYTVPSGYTAVGVVSIATSNGNLAIAAYDKTGIAVHNTTGQAISATIGLTVLFLKNL